MTSSGSSLGGLGLLADELLDLVVGHLDLELVRDDLEHELARDRAPRFAAERLAELVGGLAGDAQVGLGVEAAALERPEHPVQELGGPRLDERVGDLDVRGLDELVDGAGAEVGVELGLDRLAQALLDLGAQLGERLELARGTRQLVVERRQHRLLDLLERRLGRLLLALRRRVRDRLRLARAHPAQAALDLLDESAGAELDDVVALRLARLVDEVDDEDVAVLRRAVLDRDELRDRGAAALRARASTSSSGTSGSAAGTSRPAQSATSGGGCTATSAVKLNGWSSVVGTS